MKFNVKFIIMFFIGVVCCVSTFARNQEKDKIQVSKSAAMARDALPIPVTVKQSADTNQLTVNEEKQISRFDKEISKIASEIAENLKLSPDKPLSITTLPEDKQYMLSMEPVFNKLKIYLKPYASEIQFRSPEGSERSTLDGIIRTGNPMRIEEIQIDSLILTGSYFLMDKSLDVINCVLKIQDIRAVKLYESEEFIIYKEDCPPALQRNIFNKLLNKEAYGEIEYKGKLIEKLEKLFNSGDNNLLVPPAVYSFEKKHNYAIDYQVNALKEILTLKYGISFNEESANKIIIPADGSLIFIRDGQERQLQKIIDGEPLFGYESSKPCTTYQYRSSGKSKNFEERKFSTSGEVTVRDRIFETFNKEYPLLFNPFEFDKLNQIFSDKKEPAILVGNVKYSDPNTGKELVDYSWMTKQKWLDHLKQMHDSANRSFEVRTDVMMVFNDDLDPNRYWAIVRQNWKTKDSFGKTVYQDNGFLFVNFDFTVDRKLKDFKIYYRLWFYEYQYDDIELGTKRYQKLENDITTHFKNGIKSVSGSLKNAMCEYLIKQIRKGGDGVRIK
ncbi:MAG TPA: hypothetical protein VHO70_23850 [Chitinispirillaceae bacterium]|nr:hypothetical protein [Chitinispirillaceae bacterium]